MILNYMITQSNASHYIFSYLFLCISMEYYFFISFSFQLTFSIVNYLKHFNDTDNMIQNSDSFSYCDSKLYDNTIKRLTLNFFTLICMYLNGILCLNMFFISINIFESQLPKILERHRYYDVRV